MSTSRVVSKRLQRVNYLSILLVLDIVLSACEPVVKAATIMPTQELPITVTVTSKSGKEIPTAIARILGTTNVTALQNHKLELPYCSSGNYISVWAPGHYIKTVPCVDSQYTYELMLTPVDVNDNVDYAWMSAQTCAGCHSELQGRSELAEWSRDKHSRVFIDPYFWTVYLGIDKNGQRGTNTSWTVDGNGRVSRAPNDSIFNPGFRLDYPSENGNCIYCHAPAVAKAIEQGLDLKTWNSTVPGSHMNVETEGVTCDVCHKVTDVLVDENKLPFPERPGIRSFLYLRPGWNQIFHIGPLPDYKPQTAEDMANETKAACSQVFSESKFCAACHYGKFFNTVIYNSYGEWLNSAYSNRETSNYRSCQDCHMRSAQEVGNSSPQERAACSEANQSFHDFNHNMMQRDNNGNPGLIRNAARIGLTARIENGRINVVVSVESVGVGHKFPTDSPLRHLILVVEAKDQNGTTLAQINGSMIRPWGGVGNTTEDYAGRPGEIYANILKDKDTSVSPSVAYWNPTVPAWSESDTRLKPGVPAESQYSFAVPSNGKATITARLIYRYAFIEIIRQKNWLPNDFDVTDPVSVQVP